MLPLLEDTLRLLENRPEFSQGRVRVARRFDVGEAICAVDGDRMKQVFWNICDNALRAMPDGGVLQVSVNASGDALTIGFRDTGMGISQHQLENIFEPFHSSSPQGAGLGLAIVYQIMQAHAGRITVKTKAGQGTEFRLHLKRSAVPAEVSLAVSGGSRLG